jgi:exodeoxyribonuclease III
MKIVSWNVNGIRAVYKKGAWDYFKRVNADIFVIQETKAEAEQLPDDLRNPDGYFSYFDHSKGRKGYSGVAIFSKIKPNKIIDALGSPDHDKEGRFLAAFYENFVLINTYFPNGGGGPERLKYKLEFYDEFFKFIEKLKKEGKNVIFTGDINTAHTEIDLARPKENEKNTGFLPIERSWIDQLIENGWVDTFRNFHKDETGHYTYWDMKTFARERNVGWRIDYFFVNKEFLPNIKKSEIDPEVLGSDHCPIILEIK